MLQALSVLMTAILVAVGVSGPASTAVETEADVFTLNLVGFEYAMPIPDGGDTGHRIFVPLYGECRIDLSEGEFEVTDPNCSNDSNAAFTLPNPDPEDDGVSAYAVYIRALGQPGGNATFQSCIEDEDGTWCSTETVFVARAAGESPEQDISKQALTVCHDRDGDGEYEREQLFDDENADYFWQYDNNGLRLAQLRFYPATPTNISGPCPAV